LRISEQNFPENPKSISIQENKKNSEIKIEATFYGTICKSIEHFVMPGS